MRTLITGGLVITASDELAVDVLIEDEQGRRPRHRTRAGLADTVIDATGKYVIPGGVDGHTHMEMPFGGTFAADTFETGTRAAAWGGTTTIVDFAIQQVGGTLREGLDAWHAKAEGQCAIDYAFHMILADVNEGSLKEMEQLVGEGVTSFKMFMAYPGVFYSDDGKILRAMQRAAETGALTMMHAENGIAIDVLIEQALARGETDPRYHGVVRHELLEAEATHRAIKLAQVAGAPLYIVHLSAASALAEITQARDEGFNAFAETCPQYLFLSTDDLARPGFEGAKYVCSTPLRPVEHQAALWRGLRTDDLSVVSTDHCPFCFKGQKEMGVGDFSKIPNGLPGVETPDGPAAPGRRGRAHLPAALDRDRLRHARADVRPLPAQGHDRARRRRRRRHLRPGRRADAVRRRPTTWPSTTPATRARRSPARSRPCSPAARVVIDGGEYLGVGGPRPVRQARHLRLPALARRKQPWTSGWSCRPIPRRKPSSTSWSARRGSGSATAGRSTRTCSGRSRT